MILLDTDVMSELMRPRPASAVATWLDKQSGISVWISTVTVLEIRYGIALLPLGLRKAQLTQAFEQTVAEDLQSRIVAFDERAAEETALLMAERRRRGQQGELRDTMIAGIAIARRAMLATRNIRHFADLPVSAVDPWAA